jgi:large repetitive protein
MYRHEPSPNRRRGVVLILILGMLSLLALIGVTFATFSGQAQIGARNFSEGLSFPTTDEVMDFALSQLINDTSNPASAIRGHSLKRDMYGLDGAFNGLLTTELANGGLLRIINATTTSFNVTTAAPAPGNTAQATLPLVTTNIPASSPAYFGYNFTGWILRLTGVSFGMTYQILQQGVSNNNTVTFTLSNPPDLTSAASIAVPNAMPGLVNGAAFTLDGRYRNAFNGGGVTALANAALGVNNPAQYGNFRLNGKLLTGLPVGDYFDFNYPPLNTNTNPPTPIQPAMDEDYDAPDLENWFVAVQSADGSVVIPSFHRPSILRYQKNAAGNVVLDDWTDTFDTTTFPLDTNDPSDTAVTRNLRSRARFLRPRKIDHPLSGNTFPDLRPDPNPYLADGKTPNPNVGRITYDVDNDGDGTPDAVWVDLGFPPLRTATGQLYKPLFAFTVLPLNGRLPLNTAGNLQALGTDDPTTVPDPVNNNNHIEDGKPTFDHASHIGYSVNEVNPRYALQNASIQDGTDPNSWQNLYQQSINNGNGAYARAAAYGWYPNGLTGFAPGGFSQVDNPGLVNNQTLLPLSGAVLTDVSLTQLRNLLTGTRPQINPFVAPNSPPNTDANGNPLNGDANYVHIGTTTDANGNTVPIPLYMPNNYADSGDITNPNSPPPVFRDTPPVAGRWGEPQGIPIGLTTAFNNSVRAGRSVGLNYNPILNTYGAYDGTDDDYDTLDFFGNVAANPPNYEAADALDTYSGRMLLPSERYRRFVTPIDPSGNGRMMAYDTLPGSFWGVTTAGNNPPPIPFGAGVATYGAGPDRWGRLGFWHYFRPPGLPLVPPTQTNPNFAPPTTAPDITNNLYHGYEAYRAPGGKPGSAGPPPYFARSMFMAAAPYNTGVFPTAGTLVPTFNAAINSSSGPNSGGAANFGPNPPFTPEGTVYNGYPAGSLNRDEADEMNLYNGGINDAPFGPQDLEWLYRAHDSDALQLGSRLAALAPVSFTNPLDGLKRRRFFSTDTWELNTYSNGINIPQNLINLTTVDKFSNPATPQKAPYDLLPAYKAGIGNTYLTDLGTPSLAHRDRKINLNFPLPYSNDPDEPTRQKWVRETYWTLRAVLPGSSPVKDNNGNIIDTYSAEDCAKLSQFVLNIIDFRDPDGAMTHWQNPEVRVRSGSPPTLVSLDQAVATDQPLDQWGVEYNPIAINEVLALEFQSKAGTMSQRLFVEFVNTLVQDGNSSTACFMSLGTNGWKLSLQPDDGGSGRTNAAVLRETGQFVPTVPTTGATMTLDTGTIPLPPLLQVDSTTPTQANPGPFDWPDGFQSFGFPAPNPATARTTPNTTTTNTNYYYVLSNDPAGINPLSPPPTVNKSTNNPNTNTDAKIQTLDNLVTTVITPNSFGPSAGKPMASFYWLYLTRPADPTQRATGPGAKDVVVDSFRFVFQNPGTTITNDVPQVGQGGDGILYSVQRFQPYRGGHAVTPPTGVTTTTDYHFGYSEQTGPCTDTTSAYQERYQNANKTWLPVTQKILHTLGRPNFPTDNTWVMFPFHDRDFQGVAELLLVPGCPPGLFTKQFVENDTPNYTSPTTLPTTTNTAPPKTAFTAGTAPWGSQMGRSPHAHPYLVDKFYYDYDTTLTLTTTPPNPHDGWSVMFEYFEVPSSAIGAIANVDSGENLDWARKDLKPGLLNLNMIIDEEVFFGLVDDPRLNIYNYGAPPNPSATPPFNGTAASPTLQASPVVLPTNANSEQPTPGGMPWIVTQIDYTGAPTVDASTGARIGAYPMYWPATLNASGTSVPVQPYGRGFFYFDPNYVNPVNSTPSPIVYAGMKGAFADFLKLRHGGSGYVFSYHDPSTLEGTSATYAPTTIGSPPAPQPYRSLSMSSLNLNVMRPAFPPGVPPTAPAGSGFYMNVLFPQGATTPVPVAISNFAVGGSLTSAPTPNTLDPAKRPPAAGKPPQVYIPPRRLFQVPDSANTSYASDQGAQALPPNTTPPIFPMLSSYGGAPAAGTPQIVGSADLFDVSNNESKLLAGRSESEAYRIEVLEKVMNLTTTRTHQYAVWITVGFFEVTRPGNPELAGTDLSNWPTDPTTNRPVDPATDQLGPEIGVQAGRAVRYRSFFIVDRTRAIGFNQNNPGDFRDCVLYRRYIEQ